MHFIERIILSIVFVGCISASALASYNMSIDPPGPSVNPAAAATDTVPVEDRDGDFINDRSSNPFDLNDPDVIQQEVEYDPETGLYVITERIGDDYYRPPTYMTFDEYVEWRAQQEEQAYFGSLGGIRNEFFTFESRTDPIEQFDLETDLINRIFGGTEIDIKPQGNIDVFVGARYQNIENPNFTIRQQRQFNFDFDMDINMSVSGKIGEKLNLNTNYNTNANFDFENQLKLKFDSETFSEDDIIKTIEAGNVSLPLRSNLIQGSQSLFGVKTALQFGHLKLTAIASQQRARRENITLQGGSQIQQFEMRADEYDENRHFFLSHYNRNMFEEALENMPYINSLFKVTRLEVWITNANNDFANLREIVAVADLGEADVFTTDNAEQAFKRASIPPQFWDTKGSETRFIPDNEVNNLYRQMVLDSTMTREINTVVPTLQGAPYFFRTGLDFEQRRAKKLDRSRYNLIPELGVISLDVALQPDEVLAVAYEYTYNGESYQVGEFSADVGSFGGDSTQPASNVLFTKMLKSSTQNVSVPLWDLMMKNVYSVGAYQASEEDFRFDIYYDDPAGGQKRFLPEEDPALQTPLLSLFNMDNLNQFGDPIPDGFFDFVPGLTIFPRNGKVMFPVLEPFGSSLENLLPPDKYPIYEYQLLYDTAIWAAREFQEKNRFILKGSYKSSVQSDINLGTFNVPEGSVTVRSGGTILREGQDYIVDYQIGRVRIINDAYLSSGAPINVSFEDNALFSFNVRSMLGLRADYEISDQASIGGTFMKLWERPFTQKVNFGDDPINNNIYGLDFAFSDESSMLTRWVDAIPGIDTKAPSSVDFYVEGAALRPGHSRAIDFGIDESGTVYLDDFDGSATTYDIIGPFTQWKLSSIPEGQPQHPEAVFNDSLFIGANRALLNWYRVARNLRDLNVNNNDPYQRFVARSEIFRNQERIPNNFDFRVLDVRFYPDRRGPYNFDLPNGTPYSAGLELKGNELRLRDPESRWGGMMRELPINDFQAANYETLEFWLLNPFIDTMDQEGGKLLFHFGTISEDILKDGLSSFENGLPITGDVLPTIQTNLGKVPIVPPVINALSNNEEDRALQDVGLDGLNNNEEQEKFADYIETLRQTYPANIVGPIFEDPSNDDWEWILDYPSGTSLFERYLRFNNSQDNSPINDGNRNTNFADVNFFPDTEDLNLDGTTEKSESYYEYEIPIQSNGMNQMQLSQYISDTLQTGSDQQEIWYRFRVPLADFTDKVGGINDFRSIRFVRMMVEDFEKPVQLRFATLQLVRNQWRRVTRAYESVPPSFQPPEETQFDINEVDLFENGEKTPVAYITPPGIMEERNFQSTFQERLNEAALAMNICGLDQGHSRAVFRILNFDMRFYERLKMFVHAESRELNDDDLCIFMRLGSDYTNNYYEYELPLKLTELGPNNKISAEEVWKEDNQFDFALEILKDLKLERNDLGAPIDVPYEGVDPENEEHKIRVVGNPNLGMVNTLFVGVRNKSPETEFCAEVWLNELRLTGLDERGGVAGLARLDAQLADFGNIALSGNYSSIGWGSIDQKLQQRQREEITSYDIAGNFELGKFFPEDLGLRIPFFAQYTNTTKTPQFDPYDLDVEIDEQLQRISDPEEEREYKDLVQDRTTTKSVSFINVKKDRTNRDKKPMPWDISNFTASYAYTATEHSDPILEQDDLIQHNGSLDYRYNRGGAYIEPFKKIIKTDKWLNFIKDFNINPLPNSFSMRNTLDKKFIERKFRFTEAEDRAESRQFLWQRAFNVTWDLTRSIKLRWNSNSDNIIDELDANGFDVFGDFYGDTKEARQDYVWDRIGEFGRVRNYTQSLNAEYRLPFQKFGILDWVTATVKYDADYGWSRAPVQSTALGNNINNANRQSLRANVDFEKLYRKSGFLSEIDGRQRRGGSRQRSRTRSGQPPSGGDQDDEDDEKGKVPGIAKILIRPLMAIRKGRFNFSRDYTSFVPGLTYEPEFLGFQSGFEAPGWAFALGQQPEDDWLLDRARIDGWFSDDECQFQEVLRGYNERWDGELQIEPFRDFRIDVSINKQFDRTRSVLFKYYEINQGTGEIIEDYDFGEQNEFGSYRISYLAINTLFRDIEEIDALFDVFQANLATVSGRLNPDAPEHPVDAQGLRLGYGEKQHEVVVPAFLAAYTDRSAEDVKLDLFKTTPMPNWKLTYNGLNRLPIFEDIFSRVSISHGYTATLNVNRFNADLRYEENDIGNSQIGENLDSVSFDYYSRINIPQMVIQEQLSPLIRVDVTTVNDLSFNFEIRKARTLGLNINSQELNETRTTDITAGFGYVIKDPKIKLFESKRKRRARQRAERDRQRGGDTDDPDNPQGEDQQPRNLRITCDFSIRDDRTKQHRWGIDLQSRDARGQRAVRFAPAVEYDITQNLSLRFFIDYFMTKPYTQQQFPITNTQGGVRLRFNLN